MSMQLSDFNEIVKIFPFADTPSNPAYVYTGVIFESLGQEPLVTNLWNYVSHKFPEQSEQALVARRLREGLLKASVLVEFPRERVFQSASSPTTNIVSKGNQRSYRSQEWHFEYLAWVAGASGKRQVSPSGGLEKSATVTRESVLYQGVCSTL
jgi:hypothetical protein